MPGSLWGANGKSTTEQNSRIASSAQTIWSDKEETIVLNGSIIIAGRDLVLLNRLTNLPTTMGSNYANGAYKNMLPCGAKQSKQI